MSLGPLAPFASKAAPCRAWPTVLAKRGLAGARHTNALKLLAQIPVRSQPALELDRFKRSSYDDVYAKDAAAWTVPGSPR
jgi:hypothetical protein